MHSLASAARLLRNCDAAHKTAPLLAMLGFDAGLIPLSRENLATLGFHAELKHAHLARSNGSLRCIVFEPPDPAELRVALHEVAQKLVDNAPHLLWIVIAIHRRNEIGIAAVDASGSRARVSALVAQLSGIVDSDSETLCSLHAARSDSDYLSHCRWLEILGRESLSRRFFRKLEESVASLADDLVPRTGREVARDIALLYVSRLLFLSFLETKGWLDGDHGFLANRFADCMASGGGYHRRVLAPLFFGTLNTTPRNRAARARAFGRVPFLNGGLFSRAHVERGAAGSFFADESIGDLFGDLLTRYRFTAREDSTTWTEAAIDPEMLGKAFESLMSAGARKTTGAFYTPQSLVSLVTAAAFAHRLSSPIVSEAMVRDALEGRTLPPNLKVTLLESIDQITILDPACGSGAFLVHALEQLSHLRAHLGDRCPLHEIRRKVLTRSIFGVDVNPTAVWLCELRLWLSMAIEDPETDPLRVMRLPNLDRNIRVGNSLLGDDFHLPPFPRAGRTISGLRMRYSRATGQRKRALARALDTAERRRACSAIERRIVSLRAGRKELLVEARSRDLFGKRPHRSIDAQRRLSEVREKLRDAVAESRRLSSGGALPFAFASGFADVADRGGFDIVIGNPPWVRVHNLDAASRALLRASFDVYRNCAWVGGSEAAAAGTGFSSQVDAAALFVERSIALVQPSGVIALIVPSKLWRSLAGGGVRDFLMRSTSIREVHDLTDAGSLFDAAVYPSVVVASSGSPQRASSNNTADRHTSIVLHRKGPRDEWSIPASALPFDSSPGSPWVLLPRSVRQAFDRIVDSGPPLGQSLFGRPLLGVKTGCNDAYLVHDADVAGNSSTTTIVNSSRSGPIERVMLRPVIRGESVKSWNVSTNAARIIWPHDDDGRALTALLPHTSRWLSHWRRELEARTDARDRRAWWGAFRVEAANDSTSRVVWPDIARTLTAAVLPRDSRAIPINSCYVARCPTLDDACALAAIMNSRVASAWINVLAEPARGGYRRYMGWTMALYPLPSDWARARDMLGRIGELAISGHPPSDDDLLDAVLDAYRLERSQIESLLSWR